MNRYLLTKPEDYEPDVVHAAIEEALPAPEGHPRGEAHYLLGEVRGDDASLELLTAFEIPDMTMVAIVAAVVASTRKAEEFRAAQPAEVDWPSKIRETKSFQELRDAVADWIEASR